jgi:hypothetical protein
VAADPARRGGRPRNGQGPTARLPFTDPRLAVGYNCRRACRSALCALGDAAHESRGAGLTTRRELRIQANSRFFQQDSASEFSDGKVRTRCERNDLRDAGRSVSSGQPLRDALGRIP